MRQAGTEPPKPGSSRRTYVRSAAHRSHRAERSSYKLHPALPGGSRIGLFSFLAPPARRSWPEAAGLRHLAFAVRDAAATLTNLAAQGLRTEELRVNATTGSLTAFFDSDDLPLELDRVAPSLLARSPRQFDCRRA
ncbi:VOC family protein [Nocardia sp. CA-107356]|uniref:VOC family protein n=1 Tax=Nocardia sp. CA-107356 TaxID=3239972 RepID=UPI003D8F0727